MASESGQSAVVLNVDDHEPARYAKSRILRLGGMQVLEASSGEEALRLVAEKKPDLVLLDVKLPDMNGFEVCRRIKADPVISHTLVVQNSASFVGSDDQVRGLEGGADTYITSPIEPGVLLATVRALLRLRRAEQALAESQAEFRFLVNQIKDYAIFRIDAEGRVRSWNEGVERVLGYSQRAFIGLELSAIFVPDDIASGAAARELANAKKNGSTSDDRWMQRSDGRRFWAMGTTTAVRDAGGDLVGFIKVMRDQTEWKKAQEELTRHRDELDNLVNERTAELDKSIQRLRMSERMASLGTLAAGLGHDMGNLLLPLRLRIDTLSTIGLPESARAELDGIRSLADYLQKLSGGLKLLAADPGRAPAREATEIRAWWKEAGGVLSSTLSKSVKLRAELPDDDCWIAIGAASLTQIVFNLVQNAGDAFGAQRGGEVVVLARVDGERVVVEVADNGPGMSEEVMRRCMEPFYSTKPRGVSTGLGLALVYGLTTAAHGKVELASEEGKGTTFTVRLPLGAAPKPKDERRATAFVGLVDSRMRAFVLAEVGALGYPIEADAGRADLVVTDNAEQALLALGWCVLFMDGADREGANTIAIGARPKIQSIREALRQVQQKSA